MNTPDATHARIHQLAERFHLGAAATQRLWQLSALHQMPPRLGPWLGRGLAVLAALLLGAGLIFWVAANWPHLGRAFKLHLLQATVLASALGALAWPRGRSALLLLATLALGGLLAFVGQTYQTGADPWQLFAAWAALSLAWMLAARRDGLWALWVLVAGAGLALWAGWGSGDWWRLLAGQRPTVLWLMPGSWAVLLAWAWLLPTLKLAGPAPARLSQRVAALLALAAWCVMGLTALLEHERVAVFGLCALLVAGTGVLAWRQRPRDAMVLALAVLAANALLMGGLGYLLLRQGGDGVLSLLLLTAVTAVSLGLSGRWLYRLQREDARPIPRRPGLMNPTPGAPPDAPRPHWLAAAKAEGVLPPQAGAVPGGQVPPSWTLVALNFVGAQLVALPFLGFLALWDWALFFQAPGAFATSAALAAGALALLRGRPGLFTAQLGFSAVLAALGLLWVGLDLRLNDTALLLTAAALIAMAWGVRVPWVQAVLGFLAALAWLLLWPQQWGWLHGAQAFMPGGSAHFDGFPLPLNTVLLALLWAAWTAGEARRPGGRWRRVAHALASGAGVALLLAVAWGGTRHFLLMRALTGSATGSADVAGAGQARLFSLDAWTLLHMALVLAAAAWLARHWRLREKWRQGLHARGPGQRQGTAVTGLLALVAGVLLLACLVLPDAGVVALVGAVALGTGRRAMLALALAVLLAGLAGFYYALAWPLAHKAALLAGTGAALALALWAGRRFLGRDAAGDARMHDGAPTPSARPPAWTALLLLAGTLLAVGLVQLDVRGKERLIAQGERVYVALAPVDPRSLMQGDYMALAFDLAAASAALQDADARTAHVAVTLDARGVATVRRALGPHERLAADERRLPVQRKAGRWVVASDAFYFPEGWGAPLRQARFGEFRVLPDGRALLVGLADAQLRPVRPAPLGPPDR